MHGFHTLPVLLMLAGWLFLYAVSVMSALRGRKELWQRPILVCEAASGVVAASFLALLALHPVISGTLRVGVFAALGVISLLGPLPYRFISADQSVRIISIQHWMWYAVLWTGVPWALGLVSNDDGMFLVMASVAVAALLMNLGIGSRERHPWASVLLAVYLLSLTVAWYTRQRDIANIAAGLLLLAWASLRERAQGRMG